MKQAGSHKRPRLFVVDGNAFCYRAYYAIRSLSNSRGEPTNAIYGFVTMIRKLLAEEKPDYFAICFDRKEPTFRHEKFKDYKVHRKPMPEDLTQQIEPIKEFCRAYRITIFESPGYEADDLIGTLARKGEKEGFEIFIVTGDKDALQLVDDQIKIMNTHKEGLIYDRAKVRERFEGLGPEKVVDVMALMGDATDNIPGVPGIGEKTAIKLIQEFGSVENLMKHVNRISSKSQQTLLKDNEQIALLSKDLATIDTQVPMKLDWDQMKSQPPYEDKIVNFFKRYEFRSLLKECSPAGEEDLQKRRYDTIQNEKALAELIATLAKTGAFSFDTETTSADPMRAELVGISFAWKEFHAAYVPISSSHHKALGLPLAKTLETLRPLLENPAMKKYGQNIKYDWMVMKRNGVTLQGIAFDTMIASYLINPLKLNHNLDDISLDYLSVKKITTASLIGTGAKEITMAEVPLEKISEYASEDADCVLRLVPILQKKLEGQGLMKLFLEVELPLSEVLAKVEMAGVNLDVKFLAQLSENASGDLEKLTQKIWREAGQEFNINSTKQLAEILFIKMKLPVVKRTKTGYSTDVSVLEKLALTYELPRMLLEYRGKSKLKSTYLDALPAMRNPETGHVHTSYHQTTTATGRLSSSDPNLQNIPIKTDAGRLIRKAFIPRSSVIASEAKQSAFQKQIASAALQPRNDKGTSRKILSADYSQIELRILAHLSEDSNLMKAFREDRDIHKFTATLLYGVKEEDVTREMRYLAKTINFSIIYGKTAFGLAQDLGISISEADGFIENYFKRYAAVKSYLDSQKEKARKEGVLTTILGRRSYFPDIHSKNVQVRQFAERAAINAPIQGSAADLIKLAMIAVQNKLDRWGEASESDRRGDPTGRPYMIMQVHDELVFDAAESEIEKLSKIVRQEMEGVGAHGRAPLLCIPLRVDIFVGESWYKN